MSVQIRQQVRSCNREPKEFIGTPSTTYNGFKNQDVLVPRPTSYTPNCNCRSTTSRSTDICVPSIPATRPCNKVAMLAAGTYLAIPPFTTEIAPVYSSTGQLHTPRQSFHPTPVYLLSMISNLQGIALRLKATVFFLKPIKKENSNVPLKTGSLMANHPLVSVVVPKDTPATFTVTPGMGTLCISYTNPFTRNDFFPVHQEWQAWDDHHPIDIFPSKFISNIVCNNTHQSSSFNIQRNRLLHVHSSKL